jgi:magnesium-protoporphyrin O-methyltransferase
MNCCQIQGLEDLFNEKLVSSELDQYHRKGPAKTTRLLVDAIRRQGIQGLKLLDIGGGIGAIQHLLVASGVQQATDVDASQSYIDAARGEAHRLGIASQVHFEHGNFVDIAPRLPAADIVTLDRVICCYPDMDELVKRSLEKANRLYGLVYPRDTWWARLGIRVLNLVFRLRRSPYRSYVHSSQAVEALIYSRGFTRQYYRQTLVWQVAVYGK